MKKDREIAGLTQTEVAQRAKIDRAKLSLAECGYVRLTVEEKGAVRRVVIDALKKRRDEIAKILSEAA